MKHSTQSWCSGTTQRDGVGREEEGEFRIRGHMHPCDQFMLMYGKNYHNIEKTIILQLKQIH